MGGEFDNMIVVKNMSVSYNGVKAVKRVDIMVGRGEIHGLLGLNGAGKTTTIKCLVGLLKPDYVEELKVFGINVLSSIEYRDFIGYLPEYPSLPDYLTPREFLTYLAKIRHVKTKLKERIDYMLSLFGLDEVSDKIIVELSKGLKQRIALATVFLHEPRIVILDEPFIGLDPEGQMLVKRLLSEIINSGGAALISSHMLDTVERLCGKITIIHKGRTITSGSVKELKNGKTLEEAFFSIIGHA